MGNSNNDGGSGKSKTTLDDPVYGQKKSIDSKGDRGSDKATSSEDNIPPADDPVYAQSKSAARSSTKQDNFNDPVYGQQEIINTGADQGPARTTPAKGNIAPADDPVYSQSKTSTGENNIDPVYGQKQPIDTNNDEGPTRTSTSSSNIPPADDPVYSQSKSTASSRLNQLSSQISPPSNESSASPNTSKPRTKKSTKAKTPSDMLPADYSDILGHISRMHTLTRTPDPNNRGYARQKTAGKLWSRERISSLLVPGSWREVGSVAGTAIWRKDTLNPQAEHVDSFTPSNNPQGFGAIICKPTNQRRQIYLTADDFAVRAGHADGSNGPRTLHGEKLALRLKVPVVKLVDGSSGGGSVSTIITTGYSYIPHVMMFSTVVKQLNMGIPNLGAVVGPAVGLGAARVVNTHFSVMAADIGSLFNAGPKVVEGATFEEDLSFAELGGPSMHCTNGTIDNLAANEQECFDQIRTVLGYLPDCGMYQAPPVAECVDDVNREDLALRSIIPRKKNRMYNPYTIIESVVDKGSWFEIGRLWGRTAICGLARLGGRPTGILSNNCEVNSGALDAMGSQKLMRMIKFCDIFNLPIVQFVDVPGYAIGTIAERTATMKWGVELAKAYYSTTTPIFSVITRRAYGVAGGVMLDSRDPIMRIAWPSGEWGSLPLDGGIEVGHRYEFKVLGQKEGPEAVKARYQELEDEYRRLMNPVRTANIFNVEEITDPKDTRKICSRWVREMYGLVMQERLADRAAGRINAVFT